MGFRRLDAVLLPALVLFLFALFGCGSAPETVVADDGNASSTTSSSTTVPETTTVVAPPPGEDVLATAQAAGAPFALWFWGPH